MSIHDAKPLAEHLQDLRNKAASAAVYSDEESLDDVILELLRNPQFVQADGQAVRMHSLTDMLDARDRVAGKPCTSPGYIQKIRSGGAWGA